MLWPAARLRGASMTNPSPPGRPSLLVIDDDPDLGPILAEGLAPRMDVVVAHNWTDARARLRERRFHAVLLDLFLPDAKLMEPLEAIREQDPDYPVILMSGNLDPGDPALDRAMALGVTCLLRKPFTVENLEKRLRDCFGTLPDPC